MGTLVNPLAPRPDPAQIVSGGIDSGGTAPPRPFRTSPPMRMVSPMLVVALVLGVPDMLNAQAGALPKQEGSVSGQVTDGPGGSGIPGAMVTLLGPGPERVTRTDEGGSFRIDRVEAGQYRVRISRIGYRTEETEVGVREGEELRIERSLVVEVIDLDALAVRIRGSEAPGRSSPGGRRNEVTREQILAGGNASLNAAEILRRHVPGVRIRGQGGGTICLEYRGASSVGGDRTGCRSPAVYLDGVPVGSPTTLFASLPAETIERMEFISPVEAGARYGTGSMFGVLLIETRRPGRPTPSSPEERPAVAEFSRFDHALEATAHPAGRVFATSMAANVAGLLAGRAIAGACIEQSRRRGTGFVTTCGGMTTTGVATAAVLLPSLSASFGGGWAGRTTRSSGSLPPSAMLSALTVLSGYGMILTAEGQGDHPATRAGTLVLLLGPPLAATVSDRFFRRPRPR